MKKIMFNDEYGLTQAVLEGRKTMTRRLIKGKWFWKRCPEGMWTSDEIKMWEKECEQRLIDLSKTEEWGKAKEWAISHIANYKIGEVVAVAQRYKDVVDYLPNDPIALDTTQGFDDFAYNDYKKEAGWNNKMFVRGDLMPHQIRITNISIEKLQDISDEDCLREGISSDMFEIDPGIVDHDTGYVTKTPTLSQGYTMTKDDGRSHNKSYYEIFDSPKEAFASLINKVSHKQIWKDNPYVFVYEFTLI